MKLKYIKRMALCLALTLALSVSAFASAVPENLVVENLNGQQRITKTYVLPPDTDPEILKEPPFDYDGFTYTWAFTTKEEHTFLETKPVTETVTVETAKKDLNTILEQLAPTIPYDDGEYTGELALDHTTLSTVAAGYTTQRGSVTATKTIGPLDRNDMSYIPATTTKNGRTLSLVNVDWQVIGTDLVGNALAPASYQAVATYSGKAYSKVATGYITSADYVGEITRSDVESVTYKVTYLGTAAEGTSLIATRGNVSMSGLPVKVLPYALGILGIGTVAILSVLLFRSRRALRQLQEEPEDESEQEQEDAT